jgi:solute:Na+ symporter, SSS family
MLAPIDWIIIVTFLLLSLGIGIYYRQAAGKSLSDFFLGGRNLPWYVAGLSMVATTFAADTPLAVSELVSQGGIAKNWLWWSFLIGGALTTFFFASLWRRSGVLTELEFITLRYEGKAAHLLRSIKAIYLGLIINAVIIAWVNLAMMTLLQVFFDLDRIDAMLYTFGLMILAVIYSSLSGLKGVAITDTVQFVIAMIGCIVLAVLVVNSDEVGGMEKLKTTLPSQTFDFLPSVNDGGTGIIQGFSLSIGAFLSFVAIQWWASWYPGAEPGGGGYIAQRMMSTRNETESVWATLLFQVGHYCIRPWPWIVVGLCAIALYSPEITDPALNTQLLEASTAEASAAHYAGTAAEFIEMNEVTNDASIKSVEYFYSPRLGFVYAMKDFLPAGLVGLLLTAFMAAYLSTISTQVNWGASYLVNDLLLPNYPKLLEHDVVNLSRLVSLLVMIAGAAVTPMVTSISGVWAFIMQCGAGLGLVLILRWYWWRVNAWSELTATIVPLFAYGTSYFFLNDLFGQSYMDNNGPFFFTVIATTVSWLIVTMITGPQSLNSLKSFFEKVRPMGSWPREFTANTQHNAGLKYAFGGWISMVAFIVFTLFCIGNFVLLNTSLAMYQSGGAIISIFGLRYFLKKTNIFDRNSQLHESI